MAKKTLIITQKQLDEIVGGNSTYLDNVDSDFAQDAANKVYTGEKFDNKDSEPITTDKFAKRIRRNYGYYGYGGRIRSDVPLTITCSKGEWKKKNLVKEENQDLKGTKFGVGQSVKDNMVAAADSAGANAVKNGNISYENAKVIKTRMNKLQQQAQQGDANAQQKYEKMGGKLLQDTVTNKLDNATALSKRDKENRANMGFQNVYQKPGGTKQKKLTMPNGTNQVITYNTEINESKSIKSKKLLSILKMHGGFKKQAPWMHKNYLITNADIHNIEDNNVIGVVDYHRLQKTITTIKQKHLYGFVNGDDIDYVELNDGKFLLLIVKNAHYYNDRMNEPNTFKDLWNKTQKREQNKPFRGKHNDYYRWKSKDAEDLMFNNPYYKEWDENTKNYYREKIKNDYKKQ